MIVTGYERSVTRGTQHAKTALLFGEHCSTDTACVNCGVAQTAGRQERNNKKTKKRAKALFGFSPAFI